MILWKKNEQDVRLWQWVVSKSSLWCTLMPELAVAVYRIILLLHVREFRGCVHIASDHGVWHDINQLPVVKLVRNLKLYIMCNSLHTKHS
jgi:hypothetical protein